MHVRDATREDLDAVASLHSAAARRGGADAYDDDQVAAWARDRDPEQYPLGDPAYAVVVAVDEGRVVGFGMLHRPAGEVVAVYVAPDHAGQCVGTALLAHLEGRAAAAGHRSVELLASKNAVGFYERRGYERRGTEAVEPADGVELDCVWMGRDLGRPRGTDWGRLPA
jgi:putative acetyltransferase